MARPRRPPVTSFYNPNNRPRARSSRVNPRAVAGGGWGDYEPYVSGTGWGTNNQGGVWGGGPSASMGGDFIYDPISADTDYDWGQQPWGGIGPAPGASGAPGAGGPPEWFNFEGYMPDYSGQIETDPEYTTALADINEMNRLQEQAMRGGIKSLAIGYGGDLTELLRQGLIDQATVEAAGKNEFSTMKELGRSLTRNNARSAAELAARGILSSGALDVSRSNIQEDYGRQTTQAAQDLTRNVTGMQTGLAQGIAERRAGLNAVRSNVASRLNQLAMSRAQPATRARWNPEVGAYVAADGSGRMFDINGKPFWG